MGLQLPHILLFALIILLLFGAGRISGLMGELGKGLKSFKEGIREGDEKPAEQKQIPPQQPIDVTPRSAEPTAPPPADDQTRA